MPWTIWETTDFTAWATEVSAELNNAQLSPRVLNDLNNPSVIAALKSNPDATRFIWDDAPHLGKRFEEIRKGHQASQAQSSRQQEQYGRVISGSSTMLQSGGTATEAHSQMHHNLFVPAASNQPGLACHRSASGLPLVSGENLLVHDSQEPGVPLKAMYVLC
jgi:hypothetical protein